MEMLNLDNLALGFSVAFSPHNLLFCLIGVTLGTFIGVLPGIGALAAVAMLLPVSFHLEPTTALVMLAGVYYGAEYGGSIASIVLNIPGTPSASITCLDGYPMAQQGRAGVALFMTAIASFCGGIMGVVVMTLLSPLLTQVALSFGPAEYFSVMVLGLVAASIVSQSGALKGVLMVTVGVMLSTIGVDTNTGIERFTGDLIEMRDGISLVIVAMGLFGVSEVVSSIRSNMVNRDDYRLDYASFFPQRDEWRRSITPVLRGGSIGSFFGALPGTGQTVASYVSYALEKRFSKNKDQFGKGAIEGIMSPESANNAAAQTAFIPTLTLGIPGSTTMALMLGAMMIHGIVPGPKLMTEHADIFWGLIVSFLIGNVLLLILNIPLIGIWVRLLRVPYQWMYPTIVVLICIGVYSINNSIFDIWLTLAFGIMGYMMRLYQFEPAPLLIGFVLGSMIEEFMRRTLLLSRGDFWVFFERPISAAFLTTAILLLLWALWSSRRPKKTNTQL